MVGELQGEHQFPPESARKGRRCVLIEGAPDEFHGSDPLTTRYDTTAGCLVVYLD